MAAPKKKPNTFNKGMQSDIDPNLIPSENYLSATNGRLLSREDNSFVLKAAEGNIKAVEVSTNTAHDLFLTDEGGTGGILTNATIVAASYTTPVIKGFEVTLTCADITGSPITKQFVNGDVGSDGVTHTVDNSYTNWRYALQSCIEQLLNDSAVPDSVSLFSPSVAAGVLVLSKSLTANNLTVTYKVKISEDLNPESSIDYALTAGDGYTTSTVSEDHEIVGLANFSDYVVAMTFSSDSNSIWKLTFNANGTLAAKSLILSADLGFVQSTKVRIEVSEENEHFHRIYWTDGTQPFRTLNLKEDAGYYSSLSADDLNVFKESNLPAPIVNSISDGGKILCGSHSYCYRLITTDGKTSRASNITNPLPILKSSKGSQYHTTLGGSLSTESSSAVSIAIDGIDESYTTIQIIDIRYISKEGAIEANIITESAITGGSFQYTHNGNETTIPVSTGDLLKSAISWSVCADIAKKDNRLFAGNLTNDAASIDADFRVKSFNSSQVAHAATENPDLDEEVLYDGSNHAYTSGVNLIPGAETPDYAATNDAIRVTFHTKKFDLSKVDYFAATTVADDSTEGDIASTTLNTAPHYGFLDKTGEDGYFNNYKNPLFAEKYVGYQRGEVYRFGILFYDKGGNPTFVKPIGDIRMPDGHMDYKSINSSGSEITEGPDGQQTFKHAGNIPVKMSGCTASITNDTIVLTDSSSISVGDVVSGEGIADGTIVEAIVDGTDITISNNTVAAIDGVLFFDTPTDDVYGFALYPRFDVKLSDDTRSKIGGYSIVRVDRTDSDKTVLASGVLNQSMIHENKEENRTMRHYNGPSFGSIYTPNQGSYAISHSTFLFDTPESTLGGLNYSFKSGDELAAVSRLDGAQSVFNDSLLEHPTDENYSHLRVYNNGTYGNFISGRFNPNSNANQNSYQFSNFIIYTQFKQSVAEFKNNTTGDTTDKRIRKIGYGTNISASEKISSSKMGYDLHSTGASSRPFKNRARFSTHENFLYASPNEIDSTVESKKFDSEIFGSTAWSVEGCPSVFISLDETETELGDKLLEHKYFGIGENENNSFCNYDPGHTGHKKVLWAQKLYCQIKRNVKKSRYGGNSTAAYENNKYISTGSTDFSLSSANSVDVFGGDTFINMYSLSKSKAPWNISSGGKQPSQAIVFPVESSINIDLRDGVFFGSTDDLTYKIHDDFLMNATYSCRNTSKTFVPKPANYKDVNNYSNLLAASNLKLNGDLFDAYSTWDSNEIHELDTDKGAIYSLINLRGDLFAIQKSGVVKLGINPRVVVDNSDAAAVTVATGTGRVIERSDYIETQYGSQHYNNMVVTNTSAYWFDSNMSTFCKLVYGKGIAVQDLGLTTQNANIFNSLKDLDINDKPLDSTVGGIHLYKNERYSEVGISISFAIGGGSTNDVHLVYNELSDVMVSKKKSVVTNSVNLNGELYTTGYTLASNAGTYAPENLYLESHSGDGYTYYGINTGIALNVKFVCNESPFSTKKFDKLVVYCSGNDNTKKFDTFTFTDSKGTSFTSSGMVGDKMSNGKHIVCVTDTAGASKAEGQYLIIDMTANDDTSVELFAALTHNRIVR